MQNKVFALVSVMVLFACSEQGNLVPVGQQPVTNNPASNFACNSGRLSWGFESGSAEGFGVVNSQPSTVGSVVTTRSRSGVKSFHYEATLDQKLHAGLTDLGASCGGPNGAGLDVAGKTLSAWFFVDGPPVSQSLSSCSVIAYAGSAERQGNGVTPVLLGQWFQISAKLEDPRVGPAVDRFTVSCNLIGSELGAKWNVFVDDVSIQ